MRYKWKCLECVLREWCVFRGVAGIRLCLSKSGNWVTNLTAQLSTRRLWACVRVCVCVSISVYIYVCGFSYRTCLTHDTCFNETDLFSNVDTYFFFTIFLNVFYLHFKRKSSKAVMTLGIVSRLSVIYTVSFCHCEHVMRILFPSPHYNSLWI